MSAAHTARFIRFIRGCDAETIGDQDVAIWLYIFLSPFNRVFEWDILKTLGKQAEVKFMIGFKVFKFAQMDSCLRCIYTAAFGQKRAGHDDVHLMPQCDKFARGFTCTAAHIQNAQ